MAVRVFFFFSSRRRHTRYIGDWSSDVCSSDLNLEQLRSLFGRQGSSKVNVPLNPIKHSFFGFALGAIGSVDLRVSQMDSNLLERPSFPSSIHPNGDRSARSQGGE